MIKFILDLDGTVTAKETLPIIAKHFNIEKKIEELTRETINGHIPFVESFIKRTFILGKLPVSEINTLLALTPLLSQVVNFIHKNKEHCIIATGNLSYWIEKLMEKINCTYYSSDGIIIDNKLNKLTTILKKEDIVNKYQKQGYKVVFIGEGNNDAEAMRIADISIASAIIHKPASSVLSVANYAVYSEEALCRQLNQLL